MISAIADAAPSTIGCWGSGRFTAVKVGLPNVPASELGSSCTAAATVLAFAEPITTCFPSGSQPRTLTVVTCSADVTLGRNSIRSSPKTSCSGSV